MPRIIKTYYEKKDKKQEEKVSEEFVIFSEWSLIEERPDMIIRAVVVCDETERVPKEVIHGLMKLTRCIIFEYCNLDYLEDDTFVFCSELSNVGFHYCDVKEISKELFLRAPSFSNMIIMHGNCSETVKNAIYKTSKE